MVSYWVERDKAGLIYFIFFSQDINEMTQSIYIPRGVNTEALSQSIMWDYQPEGFKASFYNYFALCKIGV